MARGTAAGATSRKDLFVPALSLFASTSTLLCCALPALLVTVGAGAVMAGLSSHVPGYIWLSENKTGLFLLSGCLLALAGVMRWRARHAPCPVDPAAARACTRIRRWSGWLFRGSVAAYVIGGFFAYFAADLLL